MAATGNWPTPTTQDASNDGGPSQYRRNSVPLNAVVKLPAEVDDLTEAEELTLLDDEWEPTESSPSLTRMLWPTPRAADFKGQKTASPNSAKRVESGEANLCEAVAEAERKMWPTPNAADSWVPEETTENTLRRGGDGSLRSSSGSLAKDGPSGDVADPEVVTVGTGLREGGSGGVGWGRSGNGSGADADTDRVGLEGAEPIRVGDDEFTVGGDDGRPGGGWWVVEPDVGRVAHGVPSRVDRLRTLGNAVVPQVAELIGRRIVEAAG